jgi:protein TonB
VVDQVPPPPVAPIRVGTGIKPPQKIHHVAPKYPDIAQRARVSGVVVVEAVIAEDGSVRDVKILRSVPLLDDAAMDAVRQWRFTPTLLSGTPVQVIMTVTVSFALN